MTKKYLKINKKGLSLLEILIVVAIFSILGIIVTRSVLLTLRGSKKSESQIKSRENLNYTLDIIERQIRNADSIVTCPNPDTSRIDFVDENGNSGSFSCLNMGTDNAYVASGSANLRLTANDVTVTSCSFVCTAGISSNPSSVDIDVSIKDRNVEGIEGAQVNASTKILLRNY